MGGRPRLRLQSGGASGPGKGLWVGGTGKTRGVLGRGLPSPAPALVSLCTRSRAKGAPRPGGTGAFRKERKKKPPLARISGSPSRVFCPKHRGGTPLSAAPASLLPIFGLLLEEPVPQPRVAAVVTRVSAAALPGARRGPRARFPPWPAPAALPPRPARPPLRLWPPVGLRCRGDVVVKLNLTLGSQAAAQSPRLLTPSAPPRGRRAAIGAREAAEGRPDSQ